MNQLLEWSPLIVFFIAFKMLDIYWATAALMAVCVLVLVVHRWQTGSFKTMHIVTAAVVIVLGSATLLLHDRRFIQWKPTVLLALAAVAFLGSMFIGRQPLARRMLESAFNEPLHISARTWLLLNASWVGWFALLAGANIYIARNFAESVWVNFKVFGITAAMVVFMIPQVLWLHGKTKSGQAAPDQADPDQATSAPTEEESATPPSATPPSATPPSATPPNESREQRLRARLVARFAPTLLSIEDESRLHAGHAGAASGQSHFRVTIVAEAFRGASPVARHRMVYAAVDDLLKTDIHALAIEASPPAEPAVPG